MQAKSVCTFLELIMSNISERVHQHGRQELHLRYATPIAEGILLVGVTYSISNYAVLNIQLYKHQNSPRIGKHIIH